MFTRLNHSRIGRGWVAIREDERAAEAMGVNVFGLKLLAFAGGAFLAGLAGAVKAHVDVSVTPDQYVFLESAVPARRASCSAAWARSCGVLLGAALLKLRPREAAVRQRLPAADLRPAAGRHDALPSRGPDPEPAPRRWSSTRTTRSWSRTSKSTCPTSSWR